MALSEKAWLAEKAVDASSVITAALLLLSPASAIAAPKRFDCTLVTMETKETKALGSVHVDSENRLITVVFDAQAEALTVYQNGSAQTFDHVSITEGNVNGFTRDFSLGIELSSLTIVFQTYKTNPGSHLQKCSSAMNFPPG
jgi:hypothetical protein